MGVLECEWADNCFGCKYSWCKKYGSDSRNDLHLAKADMIIATFPDKNYGYYKENDLAALAKKVGATEAEVLKHANIDGWLNGTLLIWVKDRADLIKQIKAYWSDGRVMVFDNVTKAANFFGTTMQVIVDKVRYKSIYKEALLLKANTDPTEDELILLRRKVPPVGDIPAPTAQELEAIARLNEARNESQVRSDLTASILCTWKTGERLRLDSLSLVGDVLRIPQRTYTKCIKLGETYRGVTLSRLTPVEAAAMCVSEQKENPA